MKNAWRVFLIVGCVVMGSMSVVAETYTIGLLPGIVWAHFRVAEVNGFWEKQNISVELIEHQVPGDAVRGAMQRHFDFMLVPMPVIATFRSAAAFDAVYAGTFSVPTYGKSIILKKDLVNKSLKGQTIGVFVSDFANRFFLSAYLKTVNTSLADVRLVQMNTEDLEANFRHNRLQAVLTSIVDRENPFYEQTDGIMIASIEDRYEPHGLCIVKEGGISLEDLKKILRGSVEAIEWMRDPANWDEYKAILKQYIFADRPDLSDDQLRDLLKQEEFFDPQTLLQHNQQILRDYFAEYRDFLVAEGSLDAEVLDAFMYDNVVYNQALIEVLQEYAP